MALGRRRGLLLTWHVGPVSTREVVAPQEKWDQALEQPQFVNWTQAGQGDL